MTPAASVPSLNTWCGMPRRTSSPLPAGQVMHRPSTSIPSQHVEELHPLGMAMLHVRGASLASVVTG
jgi:hypothetical protein